MEKPKLYLFVGYPGSGKTTISQIIAAETGAVHIWADRERQIMFGEPNHSYEESKKLYSYLNEATGRLLKDGKSVIFDTNFNFHKDREHLRNIAEQNGATAEIIWVTTSKEVAKKRAVEESEGRYTRLYGNMTEDVFERIAGHLQPPRSDEPFIKIDGTEIDSAAVKQLLHL